MSVDHRVVLAPFATALAASVERVISARTPVPDVDDTLARAEAIAPRRVPTGLRAALAELVHVVPLARGRERVGDDGELTPFAAALRGHVEDELRARSLAAIPPAPSTGRRWPVVVGALTAVAAAIVAFAMLGGIELLRDDTGTSAEQAEQTVDSAPAPGAARVRDAAGGRPIDVRPLTPEVPEPPPAEVPGVDGSRPAAAALPREATRAPKPEGLQALAQQAEAAWRRGELVEAERIYRRIVALGGRGRQADLAYGDLFAIARQLGGADDQAALWREYLRRLPRGRFAEDARAGLCRRAVGRAQTRCWDHYLDAHPDGTHAQEARRARDGAPK